MRREDFERGAADMALSAMSNSLSEELPTEEALQPTGSPPEGQKPSTQVAGVGSSMARTVLGKQRGKLISRSSKDLVQNKPKVPQGPDYTAVDSALEEFKKHHSGPGIPGFLQDEAKDLPDFLLNEIETPDQLTQLVEKAGNVKFDEKRTWDEVSARTSTVAKVMEELRPIAEGNQTGALTDVQLHGVARIVATAFDDVSTLLTKINDGKGTPEDLLRLANAKDTYEVMHKYLKGQGSETGRALNALKMTGKALQDRDYMTYQKMTSGENGSKFAQYIKEWSAVVKKRMDKGDSVGKAMSWAAETVRSDWVRIGVEFWKNNQLSGVSTHVVNVASVGTHLMYENMVIRPTASVIGGVRTGIMGGEQAIQPGELMAPIYSAYAGVRGYLGLFWDSMWHGKRSFEAADKVEDSFALSDKIKQSNLPNAAKQGLDFATSASFKLLTATDEANRGIAFSQELYALASRQASREGMKGEAHLARMNELLDEPPVDMYNQAMDHAAQMTFTDVESKGWIASTSKALRVMVGEVPPLQFIIPYINTPSRLLHVAAEMSPLAPLSQRLRDDIAAGGVKADIATAKIVGGMGMGLAYWQLYEAGILTGTGPSDYKAQEMMKGEGWQPLSYTDENGKVWGFERMDPMTKSAKFTESLGAFLGYMDKAKYAATAEQRDGAFAQGMLALAGSMMEDQWLEQASDFIKVLEGEESFEKYIARTGAGFVPYHALAKTIKQWSDPTKPQLSQDKIESSIMTMMEDQIKGNLPGLSQEVRAKRRWDGDIFMPEQTQFAAAASPFGNTSIKSDWATKALLENGVYPEEPSSVLTFGPKQISLLQIDESGMLYDAYIQMVGEGRKEAMEKVAPKIGGQETYGPNSEAAVMLSRAMAAGKKLGAIKFYKSVDEIVSSGRVPLPPGPKTDQLLDFVADLKNEIKKAINEKDDSWLEGPLKYDAQPALESGLPESDNDLTPRM